MAGNKWLHNSSVLVLCYLLSSNWYFWAILQLITDSSTLDDDNAGDADAECDDLSNDHVGSTFDIWKFSCLW